MTPDDDDNELEAVPRGVPLTPDLSIRLLRDLVKALGDEYRLMPIGGTRMDLDVLRPGGTTKDVDIVLVVTSGGKRTVPTLDDVLKIASSLPGVLGAAKANKEGSVVRVLVQTSAGPVEVEIIRGKTPGKGGYFISRNMIEAVAKTGIDKDGQILIPLDALAFLKAWAAYDQEKLIQRTKDPNGKHARRKADFERDTVKILDALLNKDRTPNPSMLKALMDSCENKQRRAAIRKTLQNAGWPVH